jgi:uncharacterized protein (DUF1778 family)
MRTSRLELRLSDDERELDAAAADAMGETLSEFFRQAARDRATRILAERRRIVLTDDEARRFLEALDESDPKTVARLRALRERPTAFTDL